LAHAPEQVWLWRSFARRRVPRREIGLGGLLVAATLAVYWQVGWFGFLVFDDPAYVTENSQVLAGLNANSLGWAFATFHDGNWIPLTWLSLLTDATLFGAWPGGYHLTNLLLHTANVLLVFTAFNRMTRDSWRSAFVAGLFAVHPLHVESVAWVAERKDVLSLLFGLLSLNAYVQFTRQRRIGPFVLAWIFFLCSLLSKQTLVTLPFIFLLLDFWPLRRLGRNAGGVCSDAADRKSLSESAAGVVPPRLFWQQGLGPARLVIEKLPFLVLSGVFCAVALVAQSRGRAVRSLEFLPLTSRCLNAAVVYVRYVWRALFPFNLAPYYPHPGSRLSLVEVAVTFAVLSGITAMAIATVRRRPCLLVGWLWYLGGLVPMIGLVQIGGQQMADRYTYFPLLGLYAAMGWLIPAGLPVLASRKSWRPMIAVGVVAVYGAIAFVQAGYWRDSVTLFRHALAVTEDNALARAALGSALLERGQFDESLVHLARAAQMDPGDAQVHFLLGCGLQGTASLEQAAAEYRASLAIEEQNATAHNNLGLILYQQRRYADARRELLRALELDANNVRACVNLALLAADARAYGESIAFSRRALQLDPSLLVCRRLITKALAHHPDSGQME
jgi:hypothetical protein